MEESIDDDFPRAGPRIKPTVWSTLRRVISRGYNLLFWVIGGLGIVLLLLAMSKVGSYRDLPSAVLHPGNLGAVITARVAASLPFLLGALGALAIAASLLIFKAMVGRLWHGPVLAYQRAVDNWDAAHYCPTDRIVFIRTATTVDWDPVEELPRLIAREPVDHE